LFFHILESHTARERMQDLFSTRYTLHFREARDRYQLGVFLVLFGSLGMDLAVIATDGF
jgi:hypothetical protein